MPKSLASVFNLRADPRLLMDPSLPAPLTIRDCDRQFELSGVIFDLSRSGLSFSTGLLSQCRLNRVDDCILEFKPPNSDLSFAFGCRIRYRCLAGESLRFGVWFDPELTRNFEGQQSALGAYIAGRRKASLDYVFRS